MAQIERPQTPEIGKIIQLIRETRSLSPEIAFEVTRREVPQLTDDIRLLIANLPTVLPGYWRKAYCRLDASILLTLNDFKNARKNEDLEALIGHFESDYLDGAREREALFDEVFLSVREYLRPTARKGGDE